MLDAAVEAGRGAPAPSVRSAGIEAIGTALPAAAVANEAIAERLGIEPAWIEQRTGIRERRIAGPGESLTELGASAARRALAAAGVEGVEIDLVLVATFTADRVLPNAAPLIAGAVGARGAFACDLGAACTGFLSGLSLAAAQIESGRARRALVIGAELTSRVTDRDDRKTAGLFADGAGAAVVGTGAAAGSIDAIVLRSDEREADCIVLGESEGVIKMRGQDTFRAAVDALSSITLETLELAGETLADVDLFVYHQANARITAAVGERLGLPAERVVDCIAQLGNTSAATLPLALAEASADGPAPTRLARPARHLRRRLRLGRRPAQLAGGDRVSAPTPRRPLLPAHPPTRSRTAAPRWSPGPRGESAPPSPPSWPAADFPVALLCRSSADAAEEVAAEIRSGGGETLVISHDVAAADAADAAFEEVERPGARSGCSSTTPVSPPTGSRRASATRPGTRCSRRTCPPPSG